MQNSNVKILGGVVGRNIAKLQPPLENNEKTDKRRQVIRSIISERKAVWDALAKC